MKEVLLSTDWTQMNKIWRSLALIWLFSCAMGLALLLGPRFFWCSRPCQEIGDSVLRCGELEVVS